MSKDILVFSASWCNPCKSLKKALQEMQVDYQSIDIDADVVLAKHYNIRSVPTSIILKDGVEIARKNGFTTKELYLEFINSV